MAPPFNSVSLYFCSSKWSLDPKIEVTLNSEIVSVLFVRWRTQSWQQFCLEVGYFLSKCTSIFLITWTSMMQAMMLTSLCLIHVGFLQVIILVESVSLKPTGELDTP